LIIDGLTFISPSVVMDQSEGMDHMSGIGWFTTVHGTAHAVATVASGEVKATLRRVAADKTHKTGPALRKTVSDNGEYAVVRVAYKAV
jgi:hypothetical protein